MKYVIALLAALIAAAVYINTTVLPEVAKDHKGGWPFPLPTPALYASPAARPQAPTRSPSGPVKPPSMQIVSAGHVKGG